MVIARRVKDKLSSTPGWGRIDDKRLWARELPDLAYKEIPSIEHIEHSMRQLVSYLTR